MRINIVLITKTPPILLPLIPAMPPNIRIVVCGKCKSDTIVRAKNIGVISMRTVRGIMSVSDGTSLNNKGSTL
jgi:hypothetical protein